ncbi:putative nuclease HARBI1 [Rana temporaria]|uniref:putative nuclease HARBI1 n=1 Tax=Rana temporaria TaxID=8407 RepID=UPI001AADC13A|nr:putative nuclease HARBI1 [Rana temporaria]
MMPNRRRENAIIGLGVIALAQVRSRKRKNFWIKNCLLNHDEECPMPLLPELQENNPDDFRNYLHMTDACFHQLFALLSPYIKKRDTCMRTAIPAEQRLIATLRYLATGRSLQDLKSTTGISPQALGLIIPETCSAIIQVLQKDYIPFPSNPQQWQDVAAQFQHQWDFPNCGGAIAGKHIRIVPPPNSGSDYLNYKGFCSIVMLAVVSATYEFLFLDVGKNGCNSDGGAIMQTEFYKRLQNGSLNLPPAEENVEGLNFVFVADEAFALGENILKPFPMRNLTPEQRIYNYRLSRARRVVENAFGIFSSRFRLFLTPINLAVYKLNHVVLCCCILHNFLLRNSSSYLASVSTDEDPAVSGPAEEAASRPSVGVMTGLEPGHAELPSQDAHDIQQKYLEYFVGKGAVPWQEIVADYLI